MAKDEEARWRQLMVNNDNNNKKDIKEKSRKHKIDNKTNRRLVGLGACADLTTRVIVAAAGGFAHHKARGLQAVSSAETLKRIPKAG